MPSGVDVDTPVMNGGGPAPPNTMSMVASPRVNNANSSIISSYPSGLRHNPSEEGVEVVLGMSGSTKVVDSNNKQQQQQLPNQNVFRPPPHSVVQRPRPMRIPHHQQQQQPPPHHGYYAPPPPPHQHGSWGGGYGPPPRDFRGPPRHMQQQHGGPFPVPPYTNGSGSFDEQGYHHQQQQQHQPPHFSPHIHYPTGTNAPRGGGATSGYPTQPDDVNVISPNHKTTGDTSLQQQQQHGTYNPISPPQRRPPYYNYPPASPVSRPGGHSKPRLRNYAMQRGGRDYAYAPPQSSKEQPPLVADSFDSSQQRGVSEVQSVTTGGSNGSSSPSRETSSSQQSPDKDVPMPQQMYTHVGGSWSSFDSSAHPHFDDRMYFPPDSPYSPYHHHGASSSVSHYSPAGGLYAVDSFPSPRGGYPSMPYSYASFDEQQHDPQHMLRDYHPDHDGSMKHANHRSKSTTPVASNRSMSHHHYHNQQHHSSILPKAAAEVDFELTDPPADPITLPSVAPLCASMSEVNSYDVLCGRGGGTNSQIGNRRFRQLVQEFQPIYLQARRKEKPLLARTIVLIIRKRGGRFLKKNDDTGQLFEVGDEKAEAKTSQALREGLDVRATRSAANLSKKKKPKSSSTTTTAKSPTLEPKEQQQRAQSPPPLPKLQETAGSVHPHSPDHSELRKRRRLRTQDQRFFTDFMPPRAPIGHGEEEDDGVLEHSTSSSDQQQSADCTAGCAGIAMDMVTGAAQSSFCLGPRSWRR